MGWALRKYGKTPIVMVVCDTGLVLMRDGRGWNPSDFTSFQNADAAVIEAIRGWNEQSYSEGQPVTIEIPVTISVNDDFETINNYLKPLLKELKV